MKSLISVIIPTYNSAETIGTAISSILEQTYSNLEIIVIDDNSKDNTEETVEQFKKKDSRIKYFALSYDDPYRFNRRGKNINAGWMARNYGIEKAKGDWLTFQDADDASLNNRIEVQYQMAKEYNSSHVCIDWQKFDERYLRKSFNVEMFVKNNPDILVSTKKILGLVKKTKGCLFSISGNFYQWIPFLFKKRGPLKSLFFKSWESYPCAGNSPLIKKEVVNKVRFRPLTKRVWPSRRGRGADRDFNFQVAETFKNSICLKLPLYLWRVKTKNSNYIDYEKYLQKIT